MGRCAPHSIAAKMVLDRDSVATLLEEKRYDPSITPQLEEYVADQVNNEHYDLDANLALLKFYQLSPSKANLRTVTNVLVKALMQLPNSDFTLCLCLIPDSIQREETTNNLMLLSNLLESCDFTKFWETTAMMEDVLKSVPGFFDAIRKFVVVTLSISYSQVPKSLLCEALNVSLAELKGTIGSADLSGFFTGFDEAAETVEFVPNEQNRFSTKEQVDDYTTVFTKVLYSSAMISSS